jgi:hypothetical protein
MKHWILALLITLALGLCGAATQVARAEDQRLTGHVQDTGMNPFIRNGDGSELGDPLPIYWDGVWHPCDSMD